MTKISILGLTSLFLLSIAGCNTQIQPEENSQTKALQLELKASSEAFNNYWYNGEAELNSFELKQARYGEIRKGEVVMVFVTEDFLLNEQVKKESATESPVVSVMKMNFDRQFNTGIYDYSMMTSVFTPITEHQWQGPLKVSTSSQEWCGHSWSQFNQRSDAYEFQQFSYFQKEGDLEKGLALTKLEDGIWNQIRLNPEQIEEGELQMIPSTHYLRFSHQAVKAYQAQVSKGEYLESDLPGEDLRFILIDYPELDRSIKIIYEQAYPQKIAGWKEKMMSGFGSKRKSLETIAKRKASLRSQYWSKNSVADSNLRRELNLIYP